MNKNTKIGLNYFIFNVPANLKIFTIDFKLDNYICK